MSLSSDAPGIYELVVELTHLVAVTPWLNVQPDVHIVVHPGIPTALVLGGAINLSF